MKFKFSFLAALLMVQGFVFAQDSAPENWFNLDLKENKVNGVSTEKVYRELLKGKESQTIVVAVIDSGVDYEHEDLKDVMWVNPGEIAGNGIDDDKNGYVDDIHGWNFIGGKDGKNVNEDTYEVTRLYAKLMKKYKDKDGSNLKGKEKKEYEKYLSYKETVEKKRESAQSNLTQIESTATMLLTALNAIEKAMGDMPLNAENLEKVDAGADQSLAIGKNILSRMIAEGEAPESFDALRDDLMDQIEGGKKHYANQLKYAYNPDFDTRDIIGDDYSNSYEKNYGNNDVKGPDSFHGTHVAGIIAASRDNELGIKGVANNVRIMSVRTVPDGDERDKDVANAIIYAVDNGASIINMSFGKGFAWDKTAVDKAVKYACKKDVLLVHAAGNSSQNNDEMPNFPNDKYRKKGLFGPKMAKNWIEVGALSWKDGENAPATFTNYGKDNVDVFAPGVAIYSTAPEQEYQNASGTSMAAPVTAGVAAVLRSYFPTLTARQVKDIILSSTVPQNYKVIKPGTEEMIPFSDLCKTAGVVNAFEAVKKASKTKGKKKMKKKASA